MIGACRVACSHRPTGRYHGKRQRSITGDGVKYERNEVTEERECGAWVLAWDSVSFFGAVRSEDQGDEPWQTPPAR